MTEIAINQTAYQIPTIVNGQTLNKSDYNKFMKLVLKGKDLSNPVLSIDLNGVHSLTTKGLSELVCCKQYAEQNGVKLFLKNVSPVLKAFFELTRMNDFFASATSVAF
jgi:anti-anti-sigma regulatory factor